MKQNTASPNKIALVTGASGGIGSSFAKQLAAQKYDLVLSGRKEQELRNLADDITATYGVGVELVITDLSSEQGIEVLTDRVAALDNIDMLVSNAGYGERSRFEHEQVSDVMKMISVSVNATVQLVHAALPGMIRRKSGNIIAVSSLSAFVPAPGSSIYSSSKVFLNSFMESIYMEVHKYGIKVQSLCPGLVHTGFHNNSQVAHTVDARGLNLWMEPDKVVEHSLRALMKGEVICIPGTVNKLIKRLLPSLPRRSYYSIVDRIAQRFK